MSYEEEAEKPSNERIGNRRTSKSPTAGLRRGGQGTMSERTTVVGPSIKIYIK